MESGADKVVSKARKILAYIEVREFSELEETALDVPLYTFLKKTYV